MIAKVRSLGGTKTWLVDYMRDAEVEYGVPYRMRKLLAENLQEILQLWQNKRYTTLKTLVAMPEPEYRKEMENLLDFVLQGMKVVRQGHIDRGSGSRK